MMGAIPVEDREGRKGHRMVGTEARWQGGG